MPDSKLEEIARQEGRITVRLSLANVPIFSFEIPQRSSRIGERFTLKTLFESRTGKSAYEKITKFAKSFLEREYKERLLDASPDMDAPISLSFAGDDDRTEFYHVVCNYKIELNDEKEGPFAD